ncbi:MAG: MoxR family ATPase [Phycisphaerales bacterium]|nr:MAG: MoxR family ATPase [Phycisphaerales bacterium]
MKEAPDTDAIPGGSDVEAVRHLAESYRQIRTELAKVIIGQEEVLAEMITTLLCRGHCILEGVPGLAKTLMVSTLARTLTLSFSRIQFTPDLMPSDITGTDIIEEDKSTGSRQLRFVKGPVFANVVLADEINRTPPKTQAALLEAMQEHQVTAAGQPYKLPQPFFVLATQNPIEQEGTYPLPEAQLDRFMFKVRVPYPTEEEEFEIVCRTTTQETSQVHRILSAEQILHLQRLVRQVPVADHIVRWAMSLPRLTRRIEGDVPQFINDYVAWGAGPRASQYLVLAAKARAILQGRFHVSMADIKAVAHPVLRHRIITNFNAEAEGVTTDRIIDRLIREVPVEDGGELEAAGADRVLNE